MGEHYNNFEIYVNNEHFTELLYLKEIAGDDLEDCTLDISGPGVTLHAFIHNKRACRRIAKIIRGLNNHRRRFIRRWIRMKEKERRKELKRRA
jgi:hypothetical protein